MTELPDETFRPTAPAIGLAQLEFSWLVLDERLTTLTQDEFAREPAPGALRVVPRGDERSPRVTGIGDWVLELPESRSEDSGTRTIAWLVAHLTEVYFERWEWTFGGHERRPATALAYQGEVEPALALLREWVNRWRADVRALDDDRFFVIGLSQATEIDQVAPFGHLVAHLNRELIHHGSEICTLTDLYRARVSP
jgi:hypothetical protein